MRALCAAAFGHRSPRANRKTNRYVSSRPCSKSRSKVRPRSKRLSEAFFFNDPSYGTGRARPGWRVTSGVAWRTSTNQRNNKLVNTDGNISGMWSRTGRSRLHKIRRTAKQSNERMIVSTRGEQRMRDPQCVCTTSLLMCRACVAQTQERARPNACNHCDIRLHTFTHTNALNKHMQTHQNVIPTPHAGVTDR